MMPRDLNIEAQSDLRSAAMYLGLAGKPLDDLDEVLSVFALARGSHVRNLEKKFLGEQAVAAGAGNQRIQNRLQQASAPSATTEIREGETYTALVRDVKQATDSFDVVELEGYSEPFRVWDEHRDAVRSARDHGAAISFKVKTHLNRSYWKLLSVREEAADVVA